MAFTTEMTKVAHDSTVDGRSHRAVYSSVEMI